MALAGCKDDDALTLPAADGAIMPGEEVAFVTYMPGAKVTTRADRAMTNEEITTHIGSYKPVAKDYAFTVEMYEQGLGEALGSGTYKPTTTGNGDSKTYAADGTLTADATPLYWPGNAKRYAFKATAGSATIVTSTVAVDAVKNKSDQTDAVKLLAHDKLLGYGFEPVCDEATATMTDHIDALNYRTSKEWYAANRLTRGVAPGGVDAVEFYKKIPLYLQHQRSLITIKLKAGEGVSRTDLAYKEAVKKIKTYIYSYGATNDETVEVDPMAEEATVDYDSQDFGEPATSVPTTQYTAIVEPHDYLTNTSHVIAEMHISGQRFTFCSTNDELYGTYEVTPDDPDAKERMLGYNLEAGKHLIITVKLGRDSRKILITAYVEDWTEAVTTSIVDDYGQAGDPIQISSRQELYDFLTGPRNKAGNVAIIVPNSLNLEKTKTKNETTGEYEESDTPWVAEDGKEFKLNCTLNMAGATFKTNHPVFSEITSSGNLVNGTITVDNELTAAVASENHGTIERINVLPRDANGNDSENGRATRAGLVITNYGSITECTSELPVQGDGNVFVGGIAARSVYASATSTMPVIDGCEVNARVDGTNGAKGGGIVGEAAGRVTNNTFEYGITIMQDATSFKNIIQTAAATGTLRAYGNQWPTKANNDDVASTNINIRDEEKRYDAVIDSQKELGLLIQSTNNLSTLKYRLSNNFTVTKDGADGWTYGKKTTDFGQSNTVGNVFFTLDGNNKTITTDCMLFAHIEGKISDLTVRLSADLIAAHEDNSNIAPLGYSVYGDNAKISNIQVKAGNHRIEAYTPGGIVVWAYGGATIENCQCNANIEVWAKKLINDKGEVTEARLYAGGIAACAFDATITGCVFHLNPNGTLTRNMEGAATGEKADHPNIFYGGIVGGTQLPADYSREKKGVLITDCSSWYESASGKVSAVQGGIVGRAIYDDGGLKNGIADGCQGNWWSESMNGIGTRLEGTTIDQLLGKRNAVTPQQNNNYDSEAYKLP